MNKLRGFLGLGFALGGGYMMAPTYQKAFTKPKEDDMGALDFKDFSDYLLKNFSNLKLFSINNHRDLPNEVAFHLNTRISKISIINEDPTSASKISILESMRAKHVYIFCQFPKDNSINNLLVELFLTVSAARRANAGKVYVVMPYYAYQR